MALKEEKESEKSEEKEEAAIEESALEAALEAKDKVSAELPAMISKKTTSGMSNMCEGLSYIPDDDDDSSEENMSENLNSMWQMASESADEVQEAMSTARRVQARIRRISCLTGVDEHLEKHRAKKDMDDELKANLANALKRNRFCRVLNSSAIDTMVSSIEYFEFEAGDVVMEQNSPGRYFFIVDRGTFEEEVHGKVVSTLTSGGTIGGLALVYNTGRTATLKAKSPGSIWGVNGTTFRQLLCEHSRSHYSENRQLLDHMSMFDGLSSKKKERVGQLAIFTEVYDVGFVVKRAREATVAVYVVKSGKLEARTNAGKTIQTFRPNDCFGWRSVMYGELEDVDIVVAEKCELVGIGLGSLEKALGGDLALCLLRSFVVSILRKTAVFSLLPSTQVRKIAEACVTKLYKPGEKLDGDPIAALVIDGEADCIYEGETSTLQRGELFEHTELRQMEVDTCSSSGSSEGKLATNSGELVAKAPGCRFSILHAQDLIAALKSLGVPVADEDKTGLEYLKKALFVRKVPIFRELSDEQIDGLVVSLVSKRFKADTAVFEQGTVGDAFYIITSGKVDIVVDGKPIRELGPGASFGERALLFNEPRSATVKALDGDVEVWFVDRTAFRVAITESMRENLMKTIQYQGTNVTMKDIKHIRFIGAGSFGTVRLVEHKRTGLRYALKRIRKTNGQVPDEVERECKLLAENSHPFTLHFVDTFETEKSKYILTELVTGGQLHEQVLEKMGILPRKAAQFYVGSLVLTLETLHERFIAFRDLKPENVMLDMQGYIKLVDFGLAKRLGEKMPRTYTVAGTMMYMAPEVVQGSGYGTECDIWSLGVMLYEFVCGQLPFGAEAEDPQSIFEEILNKDLTFPSRYNDNAGKKLMQALLHKNIENRLGAGSTGWADIKEHKYFKQGVTGSLFSLITGRELAAPLVPEGEEYSSELSLQDKITESDSEELGRDEKSDVGCRLLTTFKKFDLAGDGCIHKSELFTVLSQLDKKTFTEEAVGALFKTIDKGNKGVLQYDDFVAWIVNDQSAINMRAALRGSIKLDIH